MKIKVKCDYCGEITLKFPYQIRADKHNFCNRGCLGKWLGNKRRGQKRPLFSDEWKNNIRLGALNKPQSLKTIQKKQETALQKHPLDVHYFDKINYRSAYLLGYFFADGCMFYGKRPENKFQPQRGLGFAVTSVDKELIDIVIKELKCFKHKIKINRPINIHQKVSYCIQIYNATILDRMFQLGLIPKKSRRITIPQEIKNTLFFDFLRGVFDGDGWISSPLRKPAFCIVSVSRKFLLQIKKRLNQFNIQPSLHQYSSGKAHRLCIYGKANIKNMYNKLYSKNVKGLYLSRKRERFYNQSIKR